MTWTHRKPKEMGGVGHTGALGTLFFISPSWSASLQHGTEEAQTAHLSHPKAHSEGSGILGGGAWNNWTRLLIKISVLEFSVFVSFLGISLLKYGRVFLLLFVCLFFVTWRGKWSLGEKYLSWVKHKNNKPQNNLTWLGESFVTLALSL